MSITFRFKKKRKEGVGVKQGGAVGGDMSGEGQSPLAPSVPSLVPLPTIHLSTSPLTTHSSPSEFPAATLTTC